MGGRCGADTSSPRVADHVNPAGGRLRRRADVAGVLVLDAAEDVVRLELAGDFLNGAAGGFEAAAGIDGAPEGEDADEPRAGHFAEADGAFHQARLVVHGEGGAEDVLLEARVDLAAFRERAFQDGR